MSRLELRPVPRRWARASALVLVLSSACGGNAQDSRHHSGGTAGASGNAGSPHSGGAAANVSGGSGGSQAADASGAAGESTAVQCAPARAPLRRLTRFEYSNTVRDLLGDTSDPGRELPLEQTSGGFSNNADTQSVSAELALALFKVAKAVAARATATPAALLALAPCAGTVSAQTADACARSFSESFASAAYRRPLSQEELGELSDLHALIRQNGGSFADATAAVIGAVLQAPDFLYRLEWGTVDATLPKSRRPSGDEMATRLSYLFWGTTPDEALRSAARNGELVTSAGVKAQATRLLNDPRSHAVVAHFFEGLLPLAALSDQSRSDAGYSAALGQQMLHGTQRFLEQAIFEQNASFSSLLTANYSFGGKALADIYGVVGSQGEALQRIELDPKQRAGLITQLAVLAGTTNPSRRGEFVRETLLCRAHPPSHPGPVPPIPSTPADGLTTRERWSAALAAAPCVPCHREMDAIGYSLENYDSIGRYRSAENGRPIDAQVDIEGLGSVQGPIDLAQKLAALPEARECFVKHWLEFGYGRSVGEAEADQCLTRQLNGAFQRANYGVRELLIELTQTDSFLYLPEKP